MINGVNRGGICQTRPGFLQIGSILGDNPQGGTIFTPNNSRPMMLIAVDGKIWQSKYPYDDFTVVPRLTFSPEAEIINFEAVLKSATLQADGVLSLIDPRAMVVIQDGLNRPGLYDGVTGSHSIAGPPTLGIPVGLWMKWVASRLWVFNKSRGYVSDLANPDTFSENVYLAGRSNFELPAEVTGVIETADENALLVFTEETTTSFKANIRDRALWAQTPDFQKVILPAIGCTGGRSAINQYGMTWWKSRQGYISLDNAMQARQSSEIVPSDDEMMRSKRVLFTDESLVCATFYENFLLVSVPSGGRYNEETWVADKVPTGRGQGIKAWVGVWTGVRPVQWMKSTFNGQERLYFLSYDYTKKDNTKIHIWEAFREDRRDNEGRIFAQWETAMVIGEDLNKFRFAELDLTEILGTVDLKVFVGGFRGPWYQILDTVLQADIGSLSKTGLIVNSTVIESFRPQSRIVRTENFSPQGKDCEVEMTGNSTGRDRGFQLLLEWKGRMGVKSIRIFSEPDPTEETGECSKSEAGTSKAINEMVETIRG